MGFLETILNLFNNNKKTAKLLTTNFDKTFGTDDAFKVILRDANDKALSDKSIQIEINGVSYTRKTDVNGVATLNIRLGCGQYVTLITFEDNDYKKTTAYSKITVNPKISTQDMKMSEKDGSQFIAIATDINGVRLENVPITFTVNGVSYNRKTGINGEAKLNINLGKGEYKITTKSLNVTNENTIYISEKPKLTTRMEGTNVNKAKSDKTQYQCAVYDANGRVNGTVEISINGVTYTRHANAEGLYKLNINLDPGSYKLTAKYLGDDTHLASQIVNTIVVVADPVKTVYNPISWLRQPNSYTCGPTSLAMCSQILGKTTSISSFSNACYTTGKGTSPANLIAGAKKLGFKLTQIPRNINGVKAAIDAGKPIVAHVMTGTMSCLGWQGSYGHYIVIYDYGTVYYYVADPTKGLGRCTHSMIDNATVGYEGIKYYSVELI